MAGRGRTDKGSAEVARSASQPDESADYRAAVRSYVAAGGDEQVQRVITAVHRLSRRLNRWYDRQLADLDVSTGEWAVLAELARADDETLTPTRLAEAAAVAPSSMTHRLDKMVQRGLVTRTGDPGNRTRVLIRLADPGWQLFATSIQQANLVESEVLAGLTERQTRELAGLLERLL